MDPDGNDYEPPEPYAWGLDWWGLLAGATLGGALVVPFVAWLRDRR